MSIAETRAHGKGVPEFLLSERTDQGVITYPLNWALYYAGRGLPVFPCGDNKRPLLGQDKDKRGNPIKGTGGFKKATTDPDQIRKWWTKWPTALMGMPTGAASGIDVLDIDCKSADGFAALPNWRVLSPAYVRTPSGGVHIWFRIDGTPLKNSTSEIAPGVDTRGEGGYVILPPSKPSRSATGYIWEKGHARDIPLLPPFPTELRQRPKGTRQKTDDTNAKQIGAGHGSQRAIDEAPEGAHGSAADRELKAAIKAVAAAEKGQRRDALNRSAFWLGQLIGADALDEAVCRRLLTEAAASVGLPEPHDPDEVKRTLDNGIADGRKQPRQPMLVLDPANPMRSARDFLGTECIEPQGRQILYRHRETFYEWTGSYYREADEESIRARVWHFLDGAFRYKDGQTVSFKPTSATVSTVIDALTAACQIASYRDPPFWLGESEPANATELFACANGLLHLPTGRLLSPTPEFFTLSASPVAHDPKAPTPQLWLNTLGQWFGDDAEAVATLQEEFGYTLTPDTSQQKLFLFHGPPRCGKGTIARVWTGLLGKDSVAGPTLASLSKEFGLQPLIGKPLAIVSDFRIGPRTDEAALAERLLSISGEDQLTIPRKFKDAWHGRLGLRLCMLSNDLPAFRDASGALPSRFVILTFKQSWLGREDPSLTKGLLAELPGILNWAVEGYRRLAERGHFVQPASGRDAVGELARLASPILSFVHDDCVIGAGYTVKVDLLYQAWKDWCERNGRQRVSSKEWFGRDLIAAFPHVHQSRPREGETRWREYEGIALRDPEI